jgi:hypothetical protein
MESENVSGPLERKELWVITYQIFASAFSNQYESEIGNI